MSMAIYIACAVELGNAGNVIQLLPAGEFRSRDGRPDDVSAWTLDDQSATALIKASTGKGKFLIDYEHQSLRATNNGQPAPAAGWFRTLEWREGEGLFATDVEWTDKARSMIKAGEYKYVSPVISYNRETGAVTKVVSVALTNSPAIDGMEEVTALSQSTKADPISALRRYMAAQGDPDALSIVDQVEALVRANANVLATLTEQGVTARRAQDQVSALKREILDAKINTVLDQALTEARLLPGQLDAARRLAESDFEALVAILDRPAVIPALLGMQSDHIRRGNDNAVALTKEEAHVCELTGRNHTEFNDLKRRFAAEESGHTD